MRTYSEVTYGPNEKLVRKSSSVEQVKDSELFESLTQYMLLVDTLPVTDLSISSSVVFSLVNFFSPEYIDLKISCDAMAFAIRQSRKEQLKQTVHLRQTCIFN